MTKLQNVNSFAKHIQTLVVSIVITLTTTSTFAQNVSIPENLMKKEISPEISLSIRSALSDTSMACGLEGAHTRHDHTQTIRRTLIQRDSVMTTDSARKLIFSNDALSQHQLLTLVESLGELNAEDTDTLLRSVYNYADALATRMMDVDIEDKETAQLVFNSHIEDIRSAVIAAVAKNKSNKMLDIVQTAAKGEGSLASSASAILKVRKIR